MAYKAEVTGVELFKYLGHLLNTYHIQLDWPLMRIWACAGIRAVDVRFKFQVQIRNPDEKLHTGLSLDF